MQRFRKIKNTTLGEAKRRPRRKKVKKVKRKRRAYTADLSGEHPLPPPFFKSFSDQQLPRKLVAVQEEPGASTLPPFRPRSFSFNDPNDFTSEEISPRSVDSFDNRKYDVDGVKSQTLYRVVHLVPPKVLYYTRKPNTQGKKRTVYVDAPLH